MHSTFTDAQGRYRVCFAPRAMTRIPELCRHGHPRETGGILIGYYSDSLDTATVSEVLPPPPDSARGRSWFVRGVWGLARRLRRLWHAQPRNYYLGEWHLHPGGAPSPSRQDLRQMQAIADGGDGCDVPVLVLVGGTPRAGFRSAVWVFRRRREPVELVAET